MLSRVPVFGNVKQEELSTWIVKGVDIESLLSQCREQYQTVFVKFIMTSSSEKLMKDKETLMTLLKIIPEKIIPNLKNPLFLSDFLTTCLDMEAHLDIQIMSLQAIFHLLQKYGLDYPNYYQRLYGLLKPQFQDGKKQDGAFAGQTLSVFNMNTGQMF